ncbi:iron-containing alcohol dehydrogenase [Candidimonas nitroreducens]|uniref:Alcohol dehydrogenase n=1 Tax=Candidimonas nitroreducens TaxID=683354 RepID=A0A225MAZ0_9BURK|nr:iron-containing alcohol dehydrogenase [Candidimonas nitroreducens]OWT57443.1 alcohol dehydrogenase [Candidimonas nitroreducens]
MNAFNFQTVPHIVVEAGAARRLGELLSQRFARGRVCVITDAPLLRMGLLDAALSSLNSSGWQVDVISDVQADPPQEVVLAISARARAQGADVVVGFGGGSSMDVAKLVAILLGSKQPLEQMYGVDKVEGARLPLVLIPTTAGTGSEVTPISIVTTGSTTKSGIVARQLYADMAVLDAELTLGLPAHITAATGIDAMVHAIEAYTSKRLKNPLSDHLAVLALRLLMGNLVRVCTNGQDAGARQAMLLGSMLAGQAFANAPVAAVHALAYPLGGNYHLPHGLTNALVLLPVLEFNLPAAAAQYAQLARELLPAAAGDDQAQATELLRTLRELVAKTGLPLRLRDHGVPKGDLPMLAADAMKQTRLLINNPREVTEQDALAVYESVY